MFEAAVPRREEKLRKLEYSEVILKEIRDREEHENLVKDVHEGAAEAATDDKAPLEDNQANNE